MKKGILQILIALFLSFSLMPDVCFSLEVNSENAQLDFYGDDAGVYYLITDPQGRKVGYDSITKQYLDEFPASFGFSLKVKDEVSEKFHSDAVFNLMPGTYTIEVIGIALTQFDLNVSISRRIISEGFTSFDFEGIIDKGLTSKIQFTYNSDPSKPAATGTRISTPSSLKQDITLSRKIGWIDNDGITNSLLKKVEAIESSISKDKKETAKNQLNAFINEVNAQNGKHISEKAANILLEDAKYMIERL